MCIFLVVVVVCGGIDASSKPAGDQYIYSVVVVLELLFAILYIYDGCVVLFKLIFCSEAGVVNNGTI
jgi:hypothetical protein